MPLCLSLSIDATRPESFLHLLNSSRIFLLLDLAARVLTNPAETAYSLLPAGYTNLQNQKPINALSWKLLTFKSNNFLVGFPGAPKPEIPAVPQPALTTTGVYSESPDRAGVPSTLFPHYSHNIILFQNLCEDSILLGGFCSETSDLKEFAASCDPYDTHSAGADEELNSDAETTQQVDHVPEPQEDATATNTNLDSHVNEDATTNPLATGAGVGGTENEHNDTTTAASTQETADPTNTSSDISQNNLDLALKDQETTDLQEGASSVVDELVKEGSLNSSATVEDGYTPKNTTNTVLCVSSLVSSFFFGFPKEFNAVFNTTEAQNPDDLENFEDIEDDNNITAAIALDPHEKAHRRKKYISRLLHYRKLKLFSKSAVLNSAFAANICDLIPAYNALFFSQLCFAELPIPSDRLSVTTPLIYTEHASTRLAYSQVLKTWAYSCFAEEIQYPLKNKHLDLLLLNFVQNRSLGGFDSYPALWNKCRVYSAATHPTLPAYEGFRFIWNAPYLKPYLIPFNWHAHSTHGFFTFWFKNLQSAPGVLGVRGGSTTDTPDLKTASSQYNILDAHDLFSSGLFNFPRLEKHPEHNNNKTALKAAAAAAKFKDLDRGAPVRWRVARALIPRTSRTKFLVTYKNKPYGWVPGNSDSYPLILLDYTSTYCTPFAFIMLFFFRLPTKRTVFNAQHFLLVFKNVLKRGMLASAAFISFSLLRNTAAKASPDTNKFALKSNTKHWKFCVPTVYNLRAVSSPADTKIPAAAQAHVNYATTTSGSAPLAHIKPSSIFFKYIIALCFFSIRASSGVFLQKIEGFGYCRLPELHGCTVGGRVTSLANSALRTQVGICLPSWFFLFCLFADIYLGGQNREARPRVNTVQQGLTRDKLNTQRVWQRKIRTNCMNTRDAHTLFFFFNYNLNFCTSAYSEYLRLLLSNKRGVLALRRINIKNPLTDKISNESAIARKQTASMLATTKRLLNTPEQLFETHVKQPTLLQYLNSDLCDMYSFASNSYIISQYANYRRQLLRIENLTKKVNSRKRRKQKKRGYIPRQRVYQVPRVPVLVAPWEYIDRYLDVCTTHPLIKYQRSKNKLEGRPAAKSTRSKNSIKKKFSTVALAIAQRDHRRAFCTQKSRDFDYLNTFNLIKRIASISYARNAFLATCDVGSNIQNIKIKKADQPGDSRLLGVFTANTTAMLSAHSEVQSTHTRRKVNFFTYTLLRQRVLSEIITPLRKTAPIWLFRRKLNIFWFRTNRQLKKTRQNLQNALSRLVQLHTYLKSKSTSAFFYKRYILRFLRFLYRTHDKKAQLTYSRLDKRLLKTPDNDMHFYKDPRKSLVNLKRPLIKIFWNSQKLWREAFFRKKRWTARKFVNYFLRWYKKNKPGTAVVNKRQTSPQLWTFLIRINLFLSKQDCTRGLISRVCLVNFKTPADIDYVLEKNDTVSLPPQYGYLTKLTLIKRLALKRIVKKNQYIYFKNKESRWKNIKKKFDKRLKNILFTKSSIPNWVQFDFFTSTLCFIKTPRRYLGSEAYSHRHALEKLNTWRLKI